MWCSRIVLREMDCMYSTFFDVYKLEEDEVKYKKSVAWKTAIGLQKVDDLEPSSYLYEIAKKHIEEDITFEYARELIKSYYIEKGIYESDSEEADKVSVRIVELISEDSFVFSPMEYINIHKRLFMDVFEHAGKIRDYNISKKEWVLDGRSVVYGSYFNLKETLEYDFSKEKEFSYIGLSKEELINHIARFISDLWQIHIFCEGNTRTTAVFLIKYLRWIGFEVDNTLFLDNSWYFRNSLVRANYSNYPLGVEETTLYLELFLENLLFKGNNDLSNKKLHINYLNGKDLSNNEIVLLNILKENSKITLEECACKMNKSLRTIKNIIKSLTEKNRLERVNGKKYGYWMIK